MIKLLSLILLFSLATQAETVESTPHLMRIKNQSASDASSNAVQCFKEVCKKETQSNKNLTANFLRDNSQLMRLTERLGHQNKDSLKQALDEMSSSIGEEQASKNIKRLKEILNTYSDTMVKDLSALCHARHAWSYSKAPSQKDIDSFENDLPGLLKIFFNKLATYTSTPSAKELGDKITPDLFKYAGPSKEEYHKNINQKISNDALSEGQSLKSKNYFKALLKGYVSSDDFPAAQDRSYRYLVNILSNISCYKNFPDSIKDGYVSVWQTQKHKKSKTLISHYINVSKETLTQKKLRDFTIYHELAHYVFSAQAYKAGASKKSIHKLRSMSKCLSRKHNSKEAVEDNFFVSEDFADMIAANIVDREAESMWCQELKDLNIENKLTNTGHSSSFFRLLHVENIKKGSLPLSCTKTIKEQNKKEDLFKNCVKP